MYGQYTSSFTSGAAPVSVKEKILEYIRQKLHLTSFQLIIYGFMLVILMGALLLMLPIASYGASNGIHIGTLHRRHRFLHLAGYI